MEAQDMFIGRESELASLKEFYIVFLKQNGNDF